MGRTIGLGRIRSFGLGFRSLVARLAPFKRESEQRGRIFWQRKVWISAPQWWDRKCEGRNKKCDFLARESVNSQQLCEFLAWESVNSSPILARQWWRHFRLSLFLSLSVSLSLSHRAYLTHNIGSASALPIIVIPRTIGNRLHWAGFDHLCLVFDHSSRGSRRSRESRKTRNKEGEIFWQRKVWTHCEFQRHNGDHLRRDGKCEGRNERAEFLAKESVNSSPILARQWWRDFRLSLSLHYRKRASASLRCARWEREREREREREIQRETEVTSP